MGFHVMHADARDAQPAGEPLGDPRADHPGADETGPGRIGDAVDIGRSQPGAGQHLGHQRQDAAHVVPRGQFRHHAAVGAVHVDLAVERVGEQTALAGIDRDASFVAGSFDAEDAHGRFQEERDVPVVDKGGVASIRSGA